jgi:hypothetical protein
MRQNNKIEKRKAFASKSALAGFLITVLLLPGIELASEKKTGNVLVLKMKDGQVGKGELLAVKGDRLILMDPDTLTDANIGIGDIARIKVVKKSKFLLGLGIGWLPGAAIGAAIGHSKGDDKPGWFSFTAETKAFADGLVGGLLGALFGGAIGAALSADESIDTGSLSPQEWDKVLNRLKDFARIT